MWYKVNFPSYDVAVCLHIVIKGDRWWKWKMYMLERAVDSSVNALLVCFQLLAFILEVLSFHEPVPANTEYSRFSERFYLL